MLVHIYLQNEAKLQICYKSKPVFRMQVDKMKYLDIH